MTITIDGALLNPPGWTVAATATDFVNEHGDVVPRSNIAYASGVAGVGTTAILATPGQPTVSAAQPLSGPVTAFSGTAGATTTQLVWNPTLVISVPAGAAEGTYTGTITHSAF